MGKALRAVVLLGAMGLTLTACGEAEVRPARSPSPETVSARAPSTPPPLPSRTAETEIRDQVSRVIDGDTFVLNDGRRVRILGIDSCEMDTSRGVLARRDLEVLVQGGVTLLAVPNVDKDRWGRLLRHVFSPAGDVAQEMVRSDHTEVYGGRNDASPGYIEALRRIDGAPRDCGGPKTPVEQPTTEDHYVPMPSGGGDDRESRFCGRRWWC